MRHAGDGHGAPAAKRSNAAPAHLAKELWIEGRSALHVGECKRSFDGVAGERRNREGPTKEETECDPPREPPRRHTALEPTKQPTTPPSPGRNTAQQTVAN